jgi:LysR family transcriptional regulator, hydrogen peroxide-inducible genes activator
LNLRDLEYLVTLSELKHFGKAAHKCFVSQPTLSSQIKKLELELDSPLIERVGKTFLLTDTGHKVVEKAKQILKLSHDIIEISKFSKNPFQGTLRVGLIPTVGPYLLPLILHHIKSEVPDLNLILSEKKTDELIASLNNGELDCGFLATPIHQANLEEQFLYNEAFVLLCPPSSNQPATSKKTIDSQMALDNKSILLLEEGHCFGEQALELCSRSKTNCYRPN